jgi:hypothetical protein
MTALFKTLTFQTQLSDDATLEKINVTFEYCKDFDNDGFNDIKITFAVHPDSNSGSEDIIGIAFDLNEALGYDWSKLAIAIDNGPLTTADTDFLVAINGVTNATFPIDIEGGGVNPLVPFDVGVQFNAKGLGDGKTQTGSFILSMEGVDLDAGTLFDGTDWFIRLQSTDGGSKSSKMGGHVNDGDLPECDDHEEPPPPPPENGKGNTPGFWKNHADIFKQETGSAHSVKYEDIFGVDVVGGKNHSDDPTILQALSAGGGGEAALLRASTAAWANATSNDVNYQIDEAALLVAAGETGANYDAVLAMLRTIDADNDDLIDAAEIIAAVQDIYQTGGNFSMADIGAVALAFDTMNNMPSVEKADFLA